MNIFKKALPLLFLLLPFTLIAQTMVVSDSALSRRIDQHLSKAKNVPVSKIVTHTYKGDVSICGFVNQNEKNATLTAIRTVPGIQTVYDGLILKSQINKYANTRARDTKQTLSDAWITTKVKQKLLTDPNVSGTNVSVQTYKGNVLLCGHLDSQAESERAISLANDTDGVRQVISGLRVKAI